MLNQVLFIVKHLVALQTSIVIFLKVVIQIICSLIVWLMVAVRTDMMLVRISDMLLKSRDMIKMPIASPAKRVVMLGKDMLVERCLTAEIPLAWRAIARV
ncbi:unnamed protein product [Fusarium graminearum]|uniref:Uncharacterized protein n=1 Tax=Gibberella zeae TaxID=5518 RepID=A0A4E9EF42_GIBZA|nr:unnamed protein product [Fusarium graminearum]CAF3600851.1 unnamed protein product [Fusarium graminearum]